MFCAGQAHADAAAGGRGGLPAQRGHRLQGPAARRAGDHGLTAAPPTWECCPRSAAAEHGGDRRGDNSLVVMLQGVFGVFELLEDTGAPFHMLPMLLTAASPQHQQIMGLRL